MQLLVLVQGWDLIQGKCLQSIHMLYHPLDTWVFPVHLTFPYALSSLLHA